VRAGTYSRLIDDRLTTARIAWLRPGGGSKGDDAASPHLFVVAISYDL